MFFLLQATVRAWYSILGYTQLRYYYPPFANTHTAHARVINSVLIHPLLTVYVRAQGKATQHSDQLAVLRHTTNANVACWLLFLWLCCSFLSVRKTFWRENGTLFVHTTAVRLRVPPLPKVQNLQGIYTTSRGHLRLIGYLGQCFVMVCAATVH